MARKKTKSEKHNGLVQKSNSVAFIKNGVVKRTFRTMEEAKKELNITD